MRFGECSPTERFSATDTGVYTRQSPQLSEALPAGAGEAILLAKELGLPLYCDDSGVRVIARNEHGVKVFSTLSLLARLRTEGVLSLGQHTELLVKMLQSHFRVVPFTPQHLSARVKALNEEARARGNCLKSADLSRDDVLSALVPGLWDPLLTLETRLHLTVGWWLELLRDSSIPQGILDATIHAPSFAIAQEASGGVIEGVTENGPAKTQALLWTGFLWRAWRLDPDLLPRAWSAVKTAATRRSETEEQYERYIWDWIPRMLTRVIDNDPALTDDEKLSDWVHFDIALPQEDRWQFESAHRSESPRFRSA